MCGPSECVVCMDRCRSCLLFFFFKQKTAYELRISDWSSDVCSSDLAKTSTLQSELFSRVAGQMTFWVEEGPSDAVLFPADGPYDRRLGYVDLPGFIDSLERQGYAIESQARISDQFAWYFGRTGRSEEHPSELQSLMRTSYAVLLLTTKKTNK